MILKILKKIGQFLIVQPSRVVILRTFPDLEFFCTRSRRKTYQYRIQVTGNDVAAPLTPTDGALTRRERKPESPRTRPTKHLFHQAERRSLHVCLSRRTSHPHFPGRFARPQVCRWVSECWAQGYRGKFNGLKGNTPRPRDRRLVVNFIARFSNSSYLKLTSLGFRPAIIHHNSLIQSPTLSFTVWKSVCTYAGKIYQHLTFFLCCRQNVQGEDLRRS